MLKYLFIPFFFIFVSCNINDSLQDINKDEPITKIPQIIYKTSLQNHEWNSGWYNQLNDLITNGGTSNHIFYVASAYFDYDQDGDYDMFVTLEHEFDIFGNIYGDSIFKNIVLRNDGKTTSGNTIWTSLDVVNFQPRVIYRRLLPGDVNNDGLIDIIGFIAEDPESKNNFRDMGGLDLFVNDGNGGFIYQEIYPYTTGQDFYFHGATLGDINNDGYIDILGFAGGIKVFLNNKGTFTDDYILLNIYKDGVLDTDIADFYSGEIFDINKDGFLDLILGTSKKPFTDLYYDFYDNSDFGKHTEIIFGKSYDFPFFDKSSRTVLYHDYDFSKENNWPEKTYCCVYDYSITDFDHDGDYDIFATVNKDEQNKSMISYYENINNQTWIPKTNDVFDDNQQFSDVWLYYIKSWDIDNDGNIELLIENDDSARITAWKLNKNNKLEKVIIK